MMHHLVCAVVAAYKDSREQHQAAPGVMPCRLMLGRSVQYSQANTATSGEQLFPKPLAKVVTKQIANSFKEGSKPKMMLVIAAAVGRNCTATAQ